MFEYWIKQTDKPSYPDLLWSRPVNKSSAGKLLIVGGNAHSFNKLAETYGSATNAGAGAIRIILPDALQKLLLKIIPEAEFAPSTASGSFALSSYAQIIEDAAWADAVLLAGEFARNSETAILLEKLVSKINIPLIIAGDTVDELLDKPELLQKDNILLCVEFGQLQKLAVSFHHPEAFVSSMTILKFVEVLHNFTAVSKLSVISLFQNTGFVGVNGQVSSTPCQANLTAIAAKASVWYMQNPDKKFEAVTTSLITVEMVSLYDKARTHFEENC